jgi:methionyl-tRNA synthetase
VKGGLQGPVDLAHDLRLGHPGAGRRKHVMYVWVDALTNYITGVGFPDDKSELFAKFWPATCMSSARTSSASTRSTGRPS